MQGTTLTPAVAPAARRRRDRGPGAAAVDTVRAHAGSFAITGRVLWALMLRNFRAQYGHRRLGLLWAFMPTIYIVTFFIVIFSLIREKQGILGHDVGPFIALGLMTLQFFQTISRAVGKAPDQGRGLLVFPRVKVMDLYVSAWLLQASVLAVVFTCLMSLFVALGQIPPPDELDRVLVPVTVAGLFGFGMGLVDTVLSRIVSGWSLIWAAIGRLLFITSGVFFIADAFPPNIKAVLWYQPILHLTEWVRSGYYADYESAFYDPWYPVACTAVLVAFGLALERVFRRRVLSGKRKR